MKSFSKWNVFTAANYKVTPGELVTCKSIIHERPQPPHKLKIPFGMDDFIIAYLCKQEQRHPTSTPKLV